MIKYHKLRIQMLVEGSKNPLPIKPPEPIKELRKPNPDWIMYKDQVKELTKQQPLDSLTNYHLRAWCCYHLDHIISIWDGYMWGIPANTIAHIDNLTILTREENTIKGRKSYSIL